MNEVNFEQHGEVGLIILNRPNRLNAISGSLTHELHNVFERANKNPDIKVIILSGEGKAFCAGDDLKDFDNQTKDQLSIESHIIDIQQITKDIMFSEKVVIGAIHGYAVGGGFEWLLNCDMVVAADDLVAFFPEMEWGQFVTGAVTYLLPNTLGHQQAMELLVLGERQSATKLQSMGLVNWVVEPEQMLEKAFEVANKVCTKSTFSVGNLKYLITQGISSQLSTALEKEQDITIKAFGTEDAVQRVKNFSARR